MSRRIRMDDAVQVAKQAAREIETWLLHFETTLDVQNVEDEPSYQRKDIDLIWTTTKKTFYIEVKGDRWHKTGNFFFETLSNKEKDTPGCFIYTEADHLFYYFIQPKTLYALPMPATRNWFLTNIERFDERATTTPVGDSFYTTVGRLVPIATVLREVPNVKKVRL